MEGTAMAISFFLIRTLTHRTVFEAASASDASGSPWTQGAMREAHRAVHEQLAL